MISCLASGTTMSFFANDRPARVADLNPMSLMSSRRRSVAPLPSSLWQSLISPFRSFLFSVVVVEGHPRGQDVVEQHPTDGRLDRRLRTAAPGRRRHLGARLDPQPHLVVDAELALRVGEEDLVRVRAEGRLGLLRGVLHRQVEDPEHDVLRRRDDRPAVRRREDVVRGEHQRRRFDLRLERQRKVDRHLVAVEVRVESRAHQRVEADRVALDQDRLERLDAHAVQGRRAVEQHGVLSRITSSRMSQTSSSFRSSIFLADLIVSA